MLDSLDAGAVRHWCAAALAALRREQREINALNVFPVADADTGTNLVLTFQAAAAALPAEAGQQGAPEVFAQMARGALLGARGNSGVILAQLLAGAAAALPPGRPVRGRALAGALEAAVAASYLAVSEPVEGTVLSVARAAADGAAAADSDDLGVVSAAAVKSARLALAGTPAQLASMGWPGVVDAGGRGLVVVLAALATVVRTGAAEIEPPPAGIEPPLAESGAPPAGSGKASGWEIQYLLDVPFEAGSRIARLRARLAEVGDSVVIACADPDAEGPTVWSVHVHSDDIGASLGAALDAGRPHEVAVSPLIDTRAFAGLDPPHPSAHRDDAGQVTGRGVVALVSGPGLARIFAAEGAMAIQAPRHAPPSVPELLAGVDRTGAREVILLANDAANAAVADAAALAAHRLESAGRTVSVLHTRSPVQGIAALAVADPLRPFQEDVVAMAEAAAATRWAEVIVADQSAYTVAGACRAGDVLGLVDGEVVTIDPDVAGSARSLLDRLLHAGGELVTLVTGAGAAPALAEDLREYLHVHWPFCECQVFEGGQPHAVLLVGVE